MKLTTFVHHSINAVPSNNDDGQENQDVSKDVGTGEYLNPTDEGEKPKYDKGSHRNRVSVQIPSESFVKNVAEVYHYEVDVGAAEAELRTRESDVYADLTLESE